MSYATIYNATAAHYRAAFESASKCEYRTAGQRILSLAAAELPADWFQPEYQRCGAQYSEELQKHLTGTRKYSGCPMPLTYTKAWRTYLDVLDDLKSEGLLRWKSGHSQTMLPGRQYD